MKRLFPRLVRSRRRGDESGQAMVEMVLIAITFLFTILGVIQLAMVLNAYSLVRYAAYNAARAGSVYAGDQDMMEEAARISLLAVFPRHGRADTALGMTENYLAALVTDDNPLLTYFFEPITEVNVLSMSGSSCGNPVVFDDPAHYQDAHLTVEVVHRYELAIPLVNRMLFWAYEQFKIGPGYQGESLNYISAETDRRRRTGTYQNIEYRIPLVAHYTMRMQSEYDAC